jgi:hypothetical protein
MSLAAFFTAETRQACIDRLDRRIHLFWARKSSRAFDPAHKRGGPEVVATLLCDGCHRISNGWFTRLRVHALRPVSMDAGNGAQGLRKAQRTHVYPPKLEDRIFTGFATSCPSMVPPFDIFKRQPGGGVRWLEVVADLEVAKLRVKELVECVPGEYFIFSLASGRRFDVRRDDVA